MQVLIRAGVCDTDEAFAAFAKGAARNADDPLLVEQAVAELDTAQTEAADVGKDIERAVRAVAANAVDFGKAVKQDTAAALKGLAQLFAEFRVSSATVAAYWPGAFAQALKFSWHLVIRSTISAGAATKPMRQPVMA